MERLKLDIQKFGGNYSVSAQVISQNKTANPATSTIRITATSSTTGDTWNEDWDGYINGSYSGGASGSLGAQYVYLPHWSSYSVSWDITVAHNADGTCGQINISCYHYITDNTNGWSSTSITPATIPRYTSVSTWSVTSKTETSVTLNWKTADTCSAIRYGTGTSSGQYTETSVNASSGSVTISGLSANTGYTLYFMPKRKDSSLWGNGSANTWKNTTQTTYNYPNCTSAPNFTIGDNNVTLSLYNPLNRSVELQMYSHVGGVFINSTRLTTTANGNYSFPIGNYINELYASIPNDKTSQYNIDVWYGNNKAIKNGGYYSVNETNNKPSLSTFKFKVLDQGTIDLMGASNDWQDYNDVTDIGKFIQNKTRLSFKLEGSTVSGNSATIKQYRVKIGNDTYYGTSTTGEVEISMSSNTLSASNTITGQIVDSRDLVGQLSFTYVINAYNIPSVNVTTLKRQPKSVLDPNADKQLLFNGTVKLPSYIISSSDPNNYKVWYKWKESTSSTYTDVTTAITPTSISTDTLTFTNILLPTLFDTSKQYNVIIMGSDYYTQSPNGSQSIVQNIPVSSPLISKRNGRVGIMKVPERGTLDVSGLIYSDNGIISDGYITAGTNIEAGTSVRIPKNSGAGYGITNSDGSSIIRDLNNQNVTVDATGATLYLGYQNTTGINMLNGQASVNSSGVVRAKGIDFKNNGSCPIEWKENGYGDKFRIIPDFGGADDSNKLKIQGTVGGAGTDPTNWKDLMTVSGKSGNVNVAGALTVGGVATLLTDAFRFRKFSKQVTVGANGMTTINMGSINAPDGYTYLGCIANNNGYGDQWVVSYAEYGGSVYAMIHSKWGASLSSNITCYAVYINNNVKSTMIL